MREDKTLNKNNKWSDLDKFNCERVGETVDP
jgi:hypothetical protein